MGGGEVVFESSRVRYGDVLERWWEWMREGVYVFEEVGEEDVFSKDMNEFVYF